MENKISQRVKLIGPSMIRVMGIKATEYDNVISLGIGEPDFHTPAEICAAAGADAAAGHTHYTPSAGYKDVVAPLIEQIKAFAGIDLDPSQVMLTHGGMGGLTAAFRALSDPGDEIIVPEPFFPSYEAQIAFAGAEMKQVRTTFDDNFTLRPEAVEAAITSRTKALVINSPNNPTGHVIPGKVLDQLAELAKAEDLIVISDEVYDRMVYTGKHESIYTRPGMAERTLVINSFSKAFAMTGWRLGYAYGPDWLIPQMLKVATFYTSCPSSVSQRAALAALKTDPAVFADQAAEFERRCRYAHKRLQAMPGVRCLEPTGSFYLFPDVSQLTDDTEQFALDLLEKEQVVVIPGGAFGPSGRGCIRLACTVNMTDLAEAMDRLERFIKAMA